MDDLKIGFEDSFAKIVDREMAPRRVAWMAKKTYFTRMDYKVAFGLTQGGSSSSIRWYLNRKLIEVHEKGVLGRHDKPTVYKFIGKI